jgi:hypothetical protein
MAPEGIRFCLVLAAVSGVTLYSIYASFLAWQRNRVVEDTPTSRVRSAAQGYVELAGMGLSPPGKDLIGPLSRKPCIWWRYKIQRRGQGGRSSSWATVDSGTSETPLILDDGTGQCLIDPEGAEVFPSTTDVWFGAEEWPLICLPAGKGVLGRIANALDMNKYRYMEHRLERRGQLYAIGCFETMGGVSVESPEREVVELLREWKQDQPALLARFDTNHDGVLGADEWDLARAAARKQVMSDRAHAPANPGMSVLSKPGDGRAFLLSGSDEETLERRLRLRTVGSLALFIASGSVLAWMLTFL